MDTSAAILVAAFVLAEAGWPNAAASAAVVVAAAVRNNVKMTKLASVLFQVQNVFLMLIKDSK